MFPLGPSQNALCRCVMQTVRNLPVNWFDLEILLIFSQGEGKVSLDKYTSLRLICSSISADSKIGICFADAKTVQQFKCVNEQK